MEVESRPAQFPSKVIGDVVRFHARQDGAKTAIIFKDSVVSYAELDAISNRLANRLLSLGLPEQACVAFLGKESEAYYQLFFACAKANLVFVPINWRLKSSEVEHIVSDSEARVLFAEEELASAVESMEKQGALLEHVVLFDHQHHGKGLDDFLGQASENDPAVDVGPDTIAVQLYTSGTTGLPKGVRLPHRALFEIRQSLIDNNLDWLDWQSTDISLVGVPGFHIGGLWWAFQGFSAGIPNVLMSMFVASDAITLIKKHKVTITCLVPAMLNLILSDLDNSNVRLDGLRKVVYGGSPISETLLKRGFEALGCEFAQIYGLTETGNTAVCLDPASHRDGRGRLAAAGRPYPCVELEIVDEHGQPLGHSSVGEIRIKTPARMDGYWKLPEATQATMQDGWINTGDVGYLDEDGYVFIVDRKSDMIIVAGENIYPAEIERVLTRHPGVFDCAIIGVPDDRWGERVVAFVVKADGCEIDSAEISSFLSKQVADYKLPSKFFFVDDLPRNASGKLLRKSLKEAFWVDRERNV